MRVSGTLERSWPTSPAEWKVEPLVSSSRSSSTTSRSPSAARWYAIEAPPTPPPMITILALCGSSRGRAMVSPHALVGNGGRAHHTADLREMARALYLLAAMTLEELRDLV